MVKDMKFVGWF